MRFLKVLFVVAIIGFNGLVGQAQEVDLTVFVKGIKEVKGKVLVQAGERSKPDKMVRGMVEVTDPDSVVCVLKGVPVGKKISVSAFQDLNGNWQLDTDEANIPIEPCNSKENVSIKDETTIVEIKLLNIKEMISNQQQSMR